MNHNFTSFFQNLRACKHHKTCPYKQTDPQSICMNGGGPYCGMYREWDYRQNEVLTH